MILKNAAIHDHFQTSGPGACGGFVVGHTQLHPDHSRLASDGGFYNFRNKLGTAEDIDDLEGLSDIQAAQALINELVPQQRQPGSGPMSDADLALFKQSLPRIINQEGGNALIVQTMRGITDYQIKMGEIADAVADRSMNPTEGRAAIRNLANPLDAYTKTVRSLENDEQDAGWREISPGVRVRKID